MSVAITNIDLRIQYCQDLRLYQENCHSIVIQSSFNCHYGNPMTAEGLNDNRRTREAQMTAEGLMTINDGRRPNDNRMTREAQLTAEGWI
jgi:hypothetical protein